MVSITHRKGTEILGPERMWILDSGLEEPARPVGLEPGNKGEEWEVSLEEKAALFKFHSIF